MYHFGKIDFFPMGNVATLDDAHKRRFPHGYFIGHFFWEHVLAKFQLKDTLKAYIWERDTLF